jgi:dTDP-4-dehydrorhamnose reductase
VRILLTGGSGRLGTELRKLRGYTAPDHDDLDVTRPEHVARTLAEVQPDLIVHAAAYTDTSLPDRVPVEAVRCWRTNVLGTRNIVDLATCPILHISTESVAHPYNFYCCTKLQAEHEVALHRHGFTIARLGFRPDPFPFAKAATDMWTLGDTTAVVAGLVDKLIDQPPANGVVYVGTGLKTVYELAQRTRPDVEGVRRAAISPRLPAMVELTDV